jgi:ribosomal protein S18 acetylase RimI-like enzyme
METTTVRNNVRPTEQVVIRPLTADDSSALLAAFEHLSLETRRLRFMSAGARLTKRDAERLTDLDHQQAEALAAIAPETGEIIGVARYFGLLRDPAAAEVAVTVNDDWQGRGIGRRLVAALAERARANGFERLVAFVDPANRRVIGWLERRGASRSAGDELGSTYTLEIGNRSTLRRAA